MLPYFHRLKYIIQNNNNNDKNVKEQKLTDETFIYVSVELQFYKLNHSEKQSSYREADTFAINQKVPHPSSSRMFINTFANLRHFSLIPPREFSLPK
jgi:hypothetical protein